MSDGSTSNTDWGDADRLAHELRNPLTIIDVRLQLIRRRHIHGAEVPQWLLTEFAMMEAAVARLRTLADRLAGGPPGRTDGPG